MTERDCQKTRDMLEAYAVGALEEHERAAVERHLQTCADCRELAAELVETAHKLPLALGAVSPYGSQTQSPWKSAKSTHSTEFTNPTGLRAG